MPEGDPGRAVFLPSYISACELLEDTKMQTGKFIGIENGEMKIEYPTTRFVFDESGKSQIVDEKRIFSYPVGGDSHRDTFFRGFGSQAGTIGFRPDLPVVGQEVQYDGPSPDMAGHLMVYVYPVEEAA